MSRPELRVVYSRETVAAPVRAPSGAQVKAVSTDEFMLGTWWAVSADCTVVSLDGLAPEDWPPAIMFLKPGSMRRAEAARALRALACEMEQDGAMH